ncbi:MAG: hypothetical protein HY279_07655 [Nitrospinae bacterium]|nr:hypothetical protein [Nitrospinota bacterium]
MSKVIRVRVSDKTYDKLQTLKGDKLLSSFLRGLIEGVVSDEHQQVEKESKDFMILIQKLDSFLNSHGQQIISDELKELKKFVCIGANKNLYILLRVLHDGDEQKIKEDYDKFKIRLQQI